MTADVVMLKTISNVYKMSAKLGAKLVEAACLSVCLESHQASFRAAMSPTIAVGAK